MRANYFSISVNQLCCILKSFVGPNKTFVGGRGRGAHSATLPPPFLTFELFMQNMAQTVTVYSPISDSVVLTPLRGGSELKKTCIIKGSHW